MTYRTCNLEMVFYASCVYLFGHTTQVSTQVPPAANCDYLELRWPGLKRMTLHSSAPCGTYVCQHLNQLGLTSLSPYCLQIDYRISEKTNVWVISLLDHLVLKPTQTTLC